MDFSGSERKGWVVGSIVHPPIGRKNTTYITLIVLAFVWGLYNPYHSLQEPEKSIDLSFSMLNDALRPG